MEGDCPLGSPSDVEHLLRTVGGLQETLGGVKETFDSIERQLRGLHEQGTEIRVRLDLNTKTVDQLDRVVRLGNGTPSMLTTVAQLRDRQERVEASISGFATRTDVDHIKSRLSSSDKTVSRVVWMIGVPLLLSIVTAVVTAKVTQAYAADNHVQHGTTPTGGR